MFENSTDEVKLVQSNTIDMHSEGVFHTLSMANCKLEDSSMIKFLSKTAETSGQLKVIGGLREICVVKLFAGLFLFSF